MGKGCVPKKYPKVSNRCVSNNYLKVSNGCAFLKVSNRRLPLKYFSVLLVIGNIQIALATGHGA